MAEDIDESKRDFLGTVTLAVTGVGAIVTSGMFVASMLPTAEVAAQGTVDVDLTGMKPGEARTVEWQGSPVFILHRTPEQIDQMQQSPGGKDPQPDKDRVLKPQWLILIGSCTHMGCVPNIKTEGWFCPCHGSKYDLSGRIISGPAPRNLVVPPYSFLDDNHIVIGKA